MESRKGKTGHWLKWRDVYSSKQNYPISTGMRLSIQQIKHRIIS